MLIAASSSLIGPLNLGNEERMLFNKGDFSPYLEGLSAGSYALAILANEVSKTANSSGVHYNKRVMSTYHSEPRFFNYDALAHTGSDITLWRGQVSL